MFIPPPIAKFSLGLGLAVAFIHPVFSQITPNGAGTVVNPQGNQINISGGTQAGANLFHSFQDFNVNSNQVANFLSNPQTQNILGRINGGNPSFINGLLQVTGGNSNLFLMNPSGMIFGQGASLNVPASFTATTANGIGFGNNVFNAFGDNNFSALIGNPDSFIFSTTQAGSIVNAGDLAVGNGQNLSLIAGNTVNTGRLTAPGGEIQVLAVPGTNRVRLSQPGQVLSLEFVPPVSNEFRAVDLPALLTGRDLPGIQLNPSGQVQVAGNSLPNQQGLAVASGRIDVSSATGNGGTVQVLGDRVAVLNSRINANGATGGGTVRLGGEYLGGRDTGIAPALRFNSQRTLVDRNSLIRANATTTGEGGRVIVWADRNTGYFGRITGRGATGRGAFVEISGRENLAFDGRVEIPGANGLFGSLLLDPTNIIIVAGANNSQADDAQVNIDATILSGDLPANMTISAGALAAIPGATAINITATNNIDFQSNITLAVGGFAPITFTAGAIIASAGVVTLNTNARNLDMVADSINAPNLSILTISGGISGNIQATANTGNLILGRLETESSSSVSGAVNIQAPQGNITINGNINTSSFSGNLGTVNIQAPQGTITVNGFIYTRANQILNGGTVELTSQGNIIVGDIDTSATSFSPNTGNGGAVNINSQGNITTGVIQTVAFNGNSGVINLTSQGNIITGDINTFAFFNGNGGYVNLAALQGNITVDGIQSSGYGMGNTSGTININTGNLLRVNSSSFCIGISICSAGDGGAGDGAITIRHGGGTNTPFTIGNSSINGTAGGIASGIGNIIPISIVPIPPGTYTQDNIQIITTAPPPAVSPSISPELLILLQNPTTPVTPAPVIVGTPPPPDPIPEPTLVSPVIPTPTATPSPTVAATPVILTVIATPVPTPQASPSPSPNISPNARSAIAPTTLNPQILLSINLGIISSTQSAAANNPSLPIIDRIPTNSLNNRIRLLDDPFKEEFQAYSGISDEIATLDVNQAQDSLQRIIRETNTKPVFIYVFFAPENEVERNVNSARGLSSPLRIPQDTDILEVVLVPPNGDLVRVKYPGLSRSQVMEAAQKFVSLTSSTSNSYIGSARQLHEWIITPLQEELKKREIDNLVFLTDVGLRSIPLAAMRDKKNGDRFIIEDYSVGLMPSLTLTDTSYTSLRGSEVLGMGAATFVAEKPLPAVPLELNAINQLWGGNTFINENFTLNNLRQARRPAQRIVHLATHGVFAPGEKSNSYIQLWSNERLTLDQIRQAGWGDPPVDLLVLSACQTALGDREAELGFAGLAVQAGVKSALASLWLVSDDGTLGLMTEFYKQLQETTTKSEALRLAQLAMLRGEVRLEGGNLITPQGTFPLNEELKKLGDRYLRHPYFWSGFTMVGNPW